MREVLSMLKRTHCTAVKDAGWLQQPHGLLVCPGLVSRVRPGLGLCKLFHPVDSKHCSHATFQR